MKDSQVITGEHSSTVLHTFIDRSIDGRNLAKKIEIIQRIPTDDKNERYTYSGKACRYS